MKDLFDTSERGISCPMFDISEGDTSNSGNEEFTTWSQVETKLDWKVNTQ